MHAGVAFGGSLRDEGSAFVDRPTGFDRSNVRVVAEFFGAGNTLKNHVLCLETLCGPRVCRLPVGLDRPWGEYD